MIYWKRPTESHLRSFYLYSVLEAAQGTQKMDPQIHSGSHNTYFPPNCTSNVLLLYPNWTSIPGASSKRNKLERWVGVFGGLRAENIWHIPGFQASCPSLLYNRTIKNALHGYDWISPILDGFCFIFFCVHVHTNRWSQCSFREFWEPWSEGSSPIIEISNPNIMMQHSTGRLGLVPEHDII